jgi:hypothetical protein
MSELIESGKGRYLLADMDANRRRSSFRRSLGPETKDPETNEQDQNLPSSSLQLAVPPVFRLALLTKALSSCTEFQMSSSAFQLPPSPTGFLRCFPFRPEKGRPLERTPLPCQNLARYGRRRLQPRSERGTASSGLFILTSLTGFQATRCPDVSQLRNENAAAARRKAPSNLLNCRGIKWSALADDFRTFLTEPVSVCGGRSLSLLDVGPCDISHTESVRRSLLSATQLMPATQKCPCFRHWAGECCHRPCGLSPRGCRRQR